MTNNSTDYVPVRSATNLFHARRFAADVGIEFASMLTVSWDAAGYSGSDGVQINRDLRQRILRAHKYRVEKGDYSGPPLRYLEVIENPDGVFHSHTLFNLPEAEQAWLSSIAVSRLTKIIGYVPDPRAINVLNVEQSGSTLKYMLKGVSPAYEEYFHLEAKPQGTVYGRRVSCSTSLGITARKHAGWKRK